MVSLDQELLWNSFLAVFVLDFNGAFSLNDEVHKLRLLTLSDDHLFWAFKLSAHLVNNQLKELVIVLEVTVKVNLNLFDATSEESGKAGVLLYVDRWGDHSKLVSFLNAFGSELHNVLVNAVVDLKDLIEGLVLHLDFQARRDDLVEGIVLLLSFLGVLSHDEEVSDLNSILLWHLNAHHNKVCSVQASLSVSVGLLNLYEKVGYLSKHYGVEHGRHNQRTKHVHHFKFVDRSHLVASNVEQSVVEHGSVPECEPILFGGSTQLFVSVVEEVNRHVPNLGTTIPLLIFRLPVNPFLFSVS